MPRRFGVIPLYSDRYPSSFTLRLNTTFIFQAVWQRMDGQGFNRSHIIPEEYEGNSVEYILGSPTTVVYLAEIENWKKNIDVKYTTISGAVF